MKVLITGATGMVGKGVLLVCLENEKVTEVISIGRRKTGIDHQKLTEIEHVDFSDFTSVKDQLTGVDACYHCMGVSAAGMPEADYSHMTYDFSLALANTMLEINPGMTFIYVSGQGTDSSEKGRQMWARVKGKTENDILNLGFKMAFMFRPGGIIPKRGIQPSSKIYRRALLVLGWLLHLIKAIAPSSIVDTDQIGLAMINVHGAGYSKSIIDPRDILALSK